MKTVKRRIIIVLICVILAIPVTIHAQVNKYADAKTPVDYSTEIVIKEYSTRFNLNPERYPSSVGPSDVDFEDESRLKAKVEAIINTYKSSHQEEIFGKFSEYVQGDFGIDLSSPYALRSYEVIEWKTELKEDSKNHSWVLSGTILVSGVLVKKIEKIPIEALVSTVDKLSNRFAEGSRFAVDKVILFGGIDNERSKEEVKDKLTEILLDKGYRVVAKEYFERLLKEQGGYSSGIYNDATTVQNNNFSAVGYLVNVKITESFVRLQVVNVSTGEYEGNVIVNF